MRSRRQAGPAGAPRSLTTEASNRSGEAAHATHFSHPASSRRSSSGSSRNVVISPARSVGVSIIGTCPAPARTTNRDPGIAACQAAPAVAGTRRSRAPQTRSVGARTSASSAATSALAAWSPPPNDVRGPRSHRVDDEPSQDSRPRPDERREERHPEVEGRGPSLEAGRGDEDEPPNKAPGRDAATRTAISAPSECPARSTGRSSVLSLSTTQAGSADGGRRRGRSRRLDRPGAAQILLHETPPTRRSGEAMQADERHRHGG